MRISIAVGLLSLALFAQVHAEDWNDLEDAEITLEKDDCKYHKIDGKRSDIRVEVDISDNDSCNATSLSVSSSFVFEGECFVKNTTEGVHECLEPGPFGLFERSICTNLDKIDMQPFTPDEADGDTQTVNGAICFGSSSYFLVFKSTCETPMKLKLEVDNKSLSNKNEKKCDKQENYRAAVEALVRRFLWLFILVGVIVIVLIIIGVVLCVCCCACCCRACKKKQPTVIVQQQTPPATEPLIPDDGPKV
ncbi:hypothetical protein BSKO_08472 [Bryopsis sp. KO-2023]|nr:hypothetical protein BSKO_08472 [Bryopsis sp. KO-2023]